MDSSIKVILLKPSTIIFTILQILTGFHYGFINIAPKKYRVFLKLLMLLFSTYIIILLFINIDTNDAKSIGFLVTIIEYICFFSILFFSKYTLYDLIVDVSDVNQFFSVNEIFCETINKAIYYPILCFLIKFWLYVPYCAYFAIGTFVCTRPVTLYLTNTIINLALDLLIIVQFLILQIFQKCLNVLRLKLLSNELNASDALKVYKILLDAFDKCKPFFDKMVITSLCFSIPIYTIVIHGLLSLLKYENDWTTFTLQYFVVLFMSMLMSLIVVTAEMINAQWDKITLILHNRLINVTDPQERFEIKATLRYMYGRPTQYYVWRRIPLDLRLIRNILSIISTYTIVIIQFTHLYD